MHREDTRIVCSTPGTQVCIPGTEVPTRHMYRDVHTGMHTHPTCVLYWYWYRVPRYPGE